MTENKIFISKRVERLKRAVQTAEPAVCTERALIWTAWHKKRSNRKKSHHVQMAGALTKVLLEKSIAIYPDELIVGNFTCQRVGGSIYPELHGVPVMLDIFKFSSRKTNPLKITRNEILKLLGIIPFWLFRFMAVKAYKSPFKKIRFIFNQLKARFYLINESGGISHIAPDYEKLITIGTNGLFKEAMEYQQNVKKESESWHFYEGVKIICKGLAGFAGRYALLAQNMAEKESDIKRKKELLKISAICKNEFQQGAESFHGALQIIFLTHIAINLESLDNSACPGRMDQYLHRFYKKDLKNKIINNETARELFASFCIKFNEIIPVFSKLLTNFHGGMSNGQVITIGGQDAKGDDAVNDLSLLMLDVVTGLGMRQPNFHARIHSKTLKAFKEKIFSILARGSNSPALYNDDIIIKTMTAHGYDIKDARNYTAVGCVEPVCQGKSFSSTDAAIFNTPAVLELALNQGRRFGSIFRTGRKTRLLSRFKSMDDVKRAFEIQLEYMMGKLIKDLKAVESANKKYHPTPLTSMLLEGCLASGRCSTAGGALYNFSGIQCVGPVDTGDAFHAIEKAVFLDKKMSFKDMCLMLENNFNDSKDLNYFLNLPKFGNDDENVDKWSVYAADIFLKTLESFGNNTRGGAYTAGLYSVTAHKYFGSITSALPNGRKNPEPFSSGISPMNSMDRKGPTALLNSMNRFDFTKFGNGINFNMKFTPHTLRGKTGISALIYLFDTYFKRGGMQAQINVLDPQILIDARDNPEKYPNLLVRVSGYSSYFNDLSLDMKNEIISRTCLNA